MNLIPCRDCGNMIEPRSRGCPTCALNLHGEKMIGRVLWCVLGLAGLLVMAVVVLVYLRR